MSQTTTREYILIATITAIEKYGVQHVTTRRIADEAGVNNAALHYYYGTKENLVEQALAMILQRMLDDTAAILSNQERYPERLSALFQYLCDVLLKYPNLIRAHLAGPLMEKDPSSPFLNMLDSWLDRTCAEFEDTMTDEVHARLRMAFQAAVSALLIAGLLPPKSGVNATVDLHDETARSTLIGILVDVVVRQLG
jgi:AcrR family transcriptional regulator